MDTFDTIIIMKRGLCKNCSYYVKYEDNLLRCAFYPSSPKTVDEDDYCKVDNLTSFGYKED